MGFKGFREVALVGKSGRHRDIAERRVSGYDLFGSKLYAQTPQIFAHRTTVLFPEHTSEMDRMDAGAAGDIIKSERSRKVVVQEFFSSPQPSRGAVIDCAARAGRFRENLKHQALKRQCGKAVGLTELRVQTVTEPIDRLRPPGGTRIKNDGSFVQVGKPAGIDLHAENAYGPILIVDGMRFLGRMKYQR